MGTTTIPCPRCGQAQTTQHDNGTEVRPRLCAACQEIENHKEAEEEKDTRALHRAAPARK
jgi:endogenous inhibitor of DNA gyrase (YacG/DUF329 family)